jgi:para-nitrobenzyl esterase
MNRVGSYTARMVSVLNLGLVVFVVLLQLQTTAVWAQEGAPMAQTKAGQLRGVVKQGGGAEFLGIPYAQPPVGELRWHEPLPAKPWAGVRDANAYGSPCAQPVLGGWNRHDAETSAEDCLYLNVVAPVWPAKGKLPVMLWLHGGANEGDTASTSFYNDGPLASHGVVVVSVNYRLGIFGFFAHPGLTRESAHHSSGNYGLMDQILALRWVIDNIDKFGGDPANITVFGQSAGAIDTGLLMTSSAKGLFQKAIEQSGASFSAVVSALADAEQAGVTAGTNLGAPAGDGALPFLRQIPARELIDKWMVLKPRPRFGPDVDGWVISRLPAVVFASGQESAIPLMFGTTTREFGASDTGMPATADGLRRVILNLAGGSAPQVLAAYGLEDGRNGANDAFYGTVEDQWPADLIFRCPATTQAQWHNAARHPTYEYEFDHAIPGQEAQGAVHSSDLPYVFGSFPKTGNLAGNAGVIDYKISDLIETYWTNFAKTGDPNSSGVPNWPQFGESQAFIQFTQDGKVVNAAGLRATQCNAYRLALAERMKLGQ